MKLTNLRRHRDAMALTRGVLSENPVLLCGLALPIAIMGTTSLRSGVALSLAMFCSMVPAMWVACVFSPQIPKMARMPACVVTAMAALQVAALFIRYISPSIFDSMGIYFPLLAVNSLMIDHPRLHRFFYPLKPWERKNSPAGQLPSGGRGIISGR